MQTYNAMIICDHIQSQEHVLDLTEPLSGGVGRRRLCGTIGACAEHFACELSGSMLLCTKHFFLLCEKVCMRAYKF